MRAYRTDISTWQTVGELAMPDLGKINEFKPHYLTEEIRWNVGQSPKRCQGQYILGSAVGELVINQNANRDGTWMEYNLRLKFDKLEDGQKLNTLIRGGRILPSISYETVQVESPFRQFRDVMREFWYLTKIHLRSRFARS